MGQSQTTQFVTRKVLLMGATYSMGGFIYGYDTGQVSGFLEMESFKTTFGDFNSGTGKYGIPTVRSGLIVGALSIGALIGSVAAGPISDCVGRKKPVLLSCLIYALGAIVQISSSNRWYQLVIGRCIGGLGVGAFSVVLPLAINETAPTNCRGFVIASYSLALTFGILIASIINLGTQRLISLASWRVTIGFDFLWVSLLAFGLIFVPESPKHLFSKGQPEKARTIMGDMLGVKTDHQILEQEIKEMEEKLNNEKVQNESEHLWYAFRSREVRLRTLLATTVMAFNQLTGINFFFYYGTSIFAAIGISNGYVIQVILGAVNVASTVPGLYFAQKYSHRRCLVIGALLMAVFFVVFSSVGHFCLDRDDATRTPAAGAVMVAMAVLFIAVFASTWSPLSWGEASMICPPQCRATCTSLAMASMWIWSFLLAFFTPMITARIDYLYGYVFSGCCVLMAVAMYHLLVESQKRTMEEVDKLYRDWLGSKRQ
ncbi:putative High-affinity fructose transporter ght6 [Seiridium cardinale]